LTAPLLRRPGPPLDAFVDCIWLWDGYVPPAPRERALPSGSVDLVIDLGADRLRLGAETFSGSALCGAHAEAFEIDTPGRIHVMGVHFKPGGGSTFFDLPAHEIAGRRVAWGDGLRARMLEAPSNEARLDAMAAFLRESAPKRNPILENAIRAFDDVALRSVADVNAATGLSPKRLGALFRDRVGLTPKAFWRVRRFQAALRELEAGERLGAEVAALVGYFDQAHFDREFRAMTGMSPRAYLAYRVERPNHVPLRG
jgi:AraC-like DNA-binding protein